MIRTPFPLLSHHNQLPLPRTGPTDPEYPHPFPSTRDWLRITKNPRRNSLTAHLPNPANPSQMNQLKFTDLALAEPIQRALASQNYITPSPIQAQSIPPLLQGHDLLGIAQTGTGKTAAFSLPILHALHKSPQRTSPKSARVLVLTPTRELANQIADSFQTYGKHLKLSQALVIGGVNKNPQIRTLKPGVDILVACPGRLLDHINEGDINLNNVQHFVLDEVDRMLDMGFLRDVKKIIATLPAKKQSLFFSATLPPTIKDLAHSILQNPKTVTITPEKTTAEKVDQEVCFTDKESKNQLLLQHLNEQKGKGLTIVFSRTKHGANKICKFLNANNLVRCHC